MQRKAEDGIGSSSEKYVKALPFRCCWEQWGDKASAEKCPITARQSDGGDNQWNCMR